MKLSDALLCLDCDEVCAESTCPACGSAVVFPLSRWLAPIEREDVEVKG